MGTSPLPPLSSAAMLQLKTIPSRLLKTSPVAVIVLWDITFISFEIHNHNIATDHLMTWGVLQLFEIFTLDLD